MRIKKRRKQRTKKGWCVRNWQLLLQWESKKADAANPLQQAYYPIY